MKHNNSKPHMKLSQAGQAALGRAASLGRLGAGNLKKSGLKHAIKRRLPGGKATIPAEALDGLPRITNETVAEHREEVLRGARKYIYPLQHSRDRIIKISVSLFAAAVVAFFVYCGLALYKFQSSSTFIYEVTRVIPFPVAKAGKSYISYENYLFELRHLEHYYQTQQKENFKDPKTAAHLTKLKQDSLQKVIDDAFVKQLAISNKITVPSGEVEDHIALVKSQNRLGSSDQMLSDVLKQFWGWSLADFRRELKSQLLSQKVASVMDTAAHAQANNALAEIQGGADFGAVAAQVSDDETTKAKGGQYPIAVSKTSRDMSPIVVDTLFRLSPGQVSQIIDAGYGLEIVKNISVSGDKVQGAHIMFRLQPVSTHLQPLKDKTKIHRYIKV